MKQVVDYNELRRRAILASIDGDVRNTAKQATKVLDAMPAKWKCVTQPAPVQRGAVHHNGTPGLAALLAISDAEEKRSRTVKVTVPKATQRALDYRKQPVSQTDIDLEALTAKVAALHAAIMAKRT